MDLENYKKNLLNKKCSLCGKSCRDSYSCLITQILNEINAEREGTKFKPMTYVALYKKIKHIPKLELEIHFSISKENKHRYGSFGKTFFSKRFFDKF